MFLILRLSAVFVALALCTPAPAPAGAASQPIVDAEGKPVANYQVSAEAGRAIARLPGAVVVGNPKGDVTLAEFYDLNCPYCRRAAGDVEAIVKSDPGLKLILVPYPVLGIPSIRAGRVEFALTQILTPQQFFEFHQKIYAGRGVVDAEQALAVARELGVDDKKLVAAADEYEITLAMKAHVQLGNALKLIATPAYVIADTAILGHPGRDSLKRAIESVRRCGKVVC